MTSDDKRSMEQMIEELRQERDLVRAIFESSPSPIAITTLEGVIQDCNAATWKGNGFSSKDEVVGRNVLDLVAEEHHDLIVESMVKTYRQGLVRDLCLTFVDAHGDEYPGELSLAVIRGPDHEPVGFVGMARDITERKRLENELAQAQRMESVGRLAGGVAHDFNNILTAVRGYANFALDTMEEDHVARADIEQVLGATERAETLTRQLLAFSRRQILNPTPLRLNALILDMSKMLRRIIPTDIELVIVPSEDLWPVKADPGQLEQMIIDLAINARDAMPAGGKLYMESGNVRVDRPGEDAPAYVHAGEYVLLSISDTGPGISEEVRRQIFEPFFTTKEEGRGTGLGLATVYGIVKQHDGFICAENREEGGTRFKIYLPRSREVADAPVQVPTADIPGGDETVLVVEDEPLVKEVTVRNLVSLGYKVLEADNGEEALRLVADRLDEIDLLLTDVVMPKMGGKELCERLRDKRPGLRTLFVSGYTDDAILRHGVRTGEINFLQKPFTLRRLARAVRDALAG